MANDIWGFDNRIQVTDPELQHVILTRQCLSFLPQMIALMVGERNSRNRAYFLHTLRLGLTLMGKYQRPDINWPEISTTFTVDFDGARHDGNYERLVTLAPTMQDLLDNTVKDWRDYIWYGNLKNDSDVPWANGQLIPQDVEVGDIRQIVDSPLIPKAATDQSDAWLARIRDLGNENPEFKFWTDFVERVFTGAQIDWDLMHRVLRIPSSVWESGPEAIAEEIAKIEAKYDLLSRIEDFEGESMTQVSRLGIGGNNPPIEINDPAIIREITVIWDVVHDLKEEVEDEAPSKAKIEKLVTLLSAGLKSILHLCGRLGEHALKVVVTLEVTKVFNPDLLEAVIEAAKRFLSSGAAG